MCQLSLCSSLIWQPSLTAGQLSSLSEWHKSCGTKTFYADFCRRKSRWDCASAKSCWWTDQKRLCAQTCLLSIICFLRSSVEPLILKWGGAAGDQDTMIYDFPFSLRLLSSKFALQRKPLYLIFWRFSPGFMNLKPHCGCPAWRGGLLFCYCRLTSR